MSQGRVTKQFSTNVIRPLSLKLTNQERNKIWQPLIIMTFSLKNHLLSLLNSYVVLTPWYGAVNWWYQFTAGEKILNVWELPASLTCEIWIKINWVFNDHFGKVLWALIFKQPAVSVCSNVKTPALLLKSPIISIPYAYILNLS